MKNPLPSWFLAVGIAMPTAAFAQIPVTVTTQASDSPMTMAEFAANTARWAQQVEQMTSQIDQMKQQYQSITGSRGMGSIMDNPALRDYLPQDWQQVYDSVRDGGYAGLSGRGKQVYAANKTFDSCSFINSRDAQRACEARAVKPSQDKAVALDVYDAAKSRLSQIDGLMSRINTTQDPKAIAELQGRIAIEQAKIQNEQTKLQMFQMVAQAEDRLQQQRQRELNAQANARRGWIQPNASNNLKLRGDVMISFIQLPILAVCFFLLLAMRRFWICIDRMGFLREVGRRAPVLVHTDILVASLAFLPFVIASVDWFGIPLPYLEGPVSPVLAAFLSVGCLGGAVLSLRDSGNRFAGHWAGTRESALRTVATLRIIDAAELAYALDFAQQHEARHGSSRGVVIDVEKQEVWK